MGKSEIVKVNLDKNQVLKLVNSIVNEKPLKIKFTSENFQGGLLPIPFTLGQLEKLSQGGSEILFPKKQVKEFKGGVLPALIPILAAVLGAVGTATSVGTSIANSVNSKKAQDKLQMETERHNRAMESLNLEPSKGKGVKLAPYKK